MLSAPPQTREEGQRQRNLPAYLTRYVPLWQTPLWFEAERWRRVVRNQPIAIACRDTIIMNVLTLGYQITARNPELTQDYRDDIDWYTKLIRDADDEGYEVVSDLVLQDMLDIPFGGIAELGRRNERPDGRVKWIKRADGGTCFPTFNSDTPVGQRLKELPTETAWFPRHTITRAYLSPRPEILRKGWGMAPPEKIYLAIELLFRGDRYYADLLLDTPEVGILDLGDMAEDVANAWFDPWRDLLTGVDPFKIPVLYEHTSEAKFISFNRSPVDMMFDKATAKYTFLC